MQNVNRILNAQRVLMHKHIYTHEHTHIQSLIHTHIHMLITVATERILIPCYFNSDIAIYPCFLYIIHESKSNWIGDSSMWQTQWYLFVRRLPSLFFSFFPSLFCSHFFPFDFILFSVRSPHIVLLSNSIVARRKVLSFEIGLAPQIHMHSLRKTIIFVIIAAGTHGKWIRFLFFSSLLHSLALFALR